MASRLLLLLGGSLLGLSVGLLLGGLVLLGALGGSLGLRIVGGGPEGQVVAEELHDQGAVAVRLLRERVELGDSVVEGLFGEVAGAVGRVQDLVVEDGEVERQTQADRVGRGQLRLGDVGGALRGFGETNSSVITKPRKPRKRRVRIFFAARGSGIFKLTLYAS